MTTISADAAVPASTGPSSLLTAAAPRPSFLSNLLALLSGQLGCAVLGVATEICYARLLGPSGRGQVSLCMMAIALGVLVGGLGGEIPVIVWTADANRRTSDWLPAVMFSGFAGCVIAVVAWLYIYIHWRPAFLTGITWPLAVIVIASVPLTVFDAYLTAILTGLERFRVRATLALVDQFAGLLFFAVLAFALGRTAESAMVGNLLGLLVGAILVGSVLRRVLRDSWKLRLAHKELGAALSLGLRGQFGNLAAFFNYRLDVFIVNYYLDPAQVGLYAVGVVVSEALWQIPQAAAIALTPRTARTLDSGATEFTCFIMRQVLLISVASGLLLAILSPLLVPLIFGVAFTSSVSVIWWILPGTIALSLAKVASADFAARSKPEYSSLYSFAALLATVALDFTLIPRMGIRGAALASSVAYALDAVLLLATLHYQLKVTWMALLIPQAADFDSYRQPWLNLVSRLKLSRASAPAGRWN
jgi:O-antigen/teichoic acid export membrane protein